MIEPKPTPLVVLLICLGRQIKARATHLPEVGDVFTLDNRHYRVMRHGCGAGPWGEGHVFHFLPTSLRDLDRPAVQFLNHEVFDPTSPVEAEQAA